MTRVEASTVPAASAWASPAPEASMETPPAHRRRTVTVLYDVGTRGSLIFVLAVLVVIFTVLKGSIFFSGSNFEQILSAQAATGILALAVTVALIAGEIDLSVSGVMGAAGGIVAFYINNGLNAVAAVSIGMAIAAAFGLLNGLAVTYGRLSSIIATLASGTIATGIGLAIVGPGTVAGLPGSFSTVFTTPWGGIQTPFFMFLATIVIAAVVLQRTPRGRRLFFVGQSPQSAELLGIRVRRLKIGSLLVSALLAGLAGLVVVGQSDGGNVTETASYLLPAFAAAFLGTSAITPGRFNAIGTFIATIVLGTATVGLNEAGVPNWTSYVFDGSLLIISLGIFTVIKIRRERSAKAHAMHEAMSGATRRAEGRAAGA